VQQNGTIDPGSVVVDKTSNVTVLDFDAQSAVRSSHLPPLPRAYAGTSLRVYLTVPY